MADIDTETIAQRLGAPFEASEVKWKPQSVSGNRAMAIAYVDARVVMDRLDDVLGVFGWQDHYSFLPDGSVMCALKVLIDGVWIEKHDVGGESSQPDEGDRRKAAVSDALKRAAVKFGVGRYLYRLKPQWMDYDQQKKVLLKVPALPSWALPGAEQPPAPPIAPPPPPPAGPPQKDSPMLLSEGISICEARLREKGLCEQDELWNYILGKMDQRYPMDVNDWPPEAQNEAREICVKFKQEKLAKQKTPLEKQLEKSRS